MLMMFLATFSWQQAGVGIRPGEITSRHVTDLEKGLSENNESIDDYKIKIKVEETCLYTHEGTGDSGDDSLRWRQPSNTKESVIVKLS